MIIALLPFFIAIVASPFSSWVASLMPFYGLPQCPQFDVEDYEDLMNRTMIGSVVTTFVINIVFAFMIFFIRYVDD
jgi:hypothetical protein